MAVDDRLPLERIQIIIHRDVDIREYLEIGFPADGCAGLARVRRLLGEAFLGAGLVLALFKVQAVLEAVTDDGDVHVLRGILRCTGTKAVQTERKLIVFASVVLVFAASVQLAEDKLPVVTLLVFVPFDRDTAAVVSDFDRAVRVARGNDLGAVALSCLVDRVGQNLKDRVLAAFQSVRAEDNTRALAHTVRALQRGDTFIAVRRLCFAHIYFNSQFPKFCLFFCN